MRKGIEGLFTSINALIKERELNNHVSMSVKEISEAVKKEVDIFSAETGWYIDQSIKAAVVTALSQNGYRSVIKGEGYFVNPHIADNPEYLKRLFNNAALDKSQKEQIVQMLHGRMQETGIEGQLSFDFTGRIHEDITEQKLLELLKQDSE